MQVQDSCCAESSNYSIVPALRAGIIHNDKQ